jgi:diguanylate cyclase (GGDEF)-like protein
MANRIVHLQKQRDEAEEQARRNLEVRQEELERLVNERTTEIERLAQSDPLTGTLNRRGLLRAMDRLTAIGYQSLSLIMLDIDHFKSVNDNFGHAEGDRILTRVASVVHSCLRAGDHLARVGGEEFMVLLPDTDTSAAYAVAERIRTSVQRTVQIDPRRRATELTDGQITPHMARSSKAVTVSLGVTSMHRTSHDDVADPTIILESLQRRADAALYRSKGAGRNQANIYDDRRGPVTLFDPDI